LQKLTRAFYFWYNFLEENYNFTEKKGKSIFVLPVFSLLAVLGERNNPNRDVTV
jgi:hypothetical protein